MIDIDEHLHGIILGEIVKVVKDVAKEAQKEIDSYDSYGGPPLSGRQNEVIRKATAEAIVQKILELHIPQITTLSSMVGVIQKYLKAYDEATGTIHVEKDMRRTLKQFEFDFNISL